MSVLDEAKKDFSVYDNAKGRIEKLIQRWETENTETKYRREMRNIDVDVESERVEGTLEKDELYIPVRTIETNIKREQAHYIAFLKQARRQAIFKCLEDAALDTTPLEKDFTDKARYDSWETAYYELIDGFQTHGWDSVEIEYDINKPGHFSVVHIGHENLIFTPGALNIQALEFVCVRKFFSALQLFEFTKTADFSVSEVEKVLEASKNDKDTEGLDASLFEVYKIFFKRGGIVHVAWAAAPKIASDWLRAPKPLFLGRRRRITTPNGDQVAWADEKETEYPIVVFPYQIAESGRITDVKGRVFYDQYVQQGASSLMSSFVTQHRRSSNVFVSGLNSESDGSPKQTNVKVIPGMIIEGDVKFATLPPPSPDMLNAVQAMVLNNQNEQSQVNYAATNRKDSRKTAEEIKTAQAEAGLLSSVQVSLFSISCRRINLFCWNIYKSAVQQGLVKPTCDMRYFEGLTYSIYSAGDQDVIERRERVMQMMQTWPVVQAMGPGFALEFFKDMITLMFPEMSQKYISLLGTDQSLMNKISGLQQVLRAIVVDPETGELIPVAQPFAQQIGQLIGDENTQTQTKAA